MKTIKITWVLVEWLFLRHRDSKSLVYKNVFKRKFIWFSKTKDHFHVKFFLYEKKWKNNPLLSASNSPQYKGNSLKHQHFQKTESLTGRFFCFCQFFVFGLKNLNFATLTRMQVKLFYSFFVFYKNKLIYFSSSM